MPRKTTTKFVSPMGGSRRRNNPARHEIPEPAVVMGIFDTARYLRDFSTLNHLTAVPFKIGKKEVVA